jgi:peptide deformylase
MVDLTLAIFFIPAVHNMFSHQGALPKQNGWFKCRVDQSLVVYFILRTSNFALHLLSLDFFIFAVMILPIMAYGSPVLRQVAKDIAADYPDLEKLIADMWETMYASNGVGLAAPQVNRSIRLFTVDSTQIFDNQDEDEKGIYPDEPGTKGVFINAHIVGLNGEKWSYNEGCLSIPKVREDISRNAEVTLEYVDENFASHQQTFNGITARIILHEYDHLEGKLFIDHISLLKKKLIRKKLDDISKGKIKVDYKMAFQK